MNPEQQQLIRALLAMAEVAGRVQSSEGGDRTGRKYTARRGVRFYEHTGTWYMAATDGFVLLRREVTDALSALVWNKYQPALIHAMLIEEYRGDLLRSWDSAQFSWDEHGLTVSFWEECDIPAPDDDDEDDTTDYGSDRTIFMPALHPAYNAAYPGIDSVIIAQCLQQLAGAPAIRAGDVAAFPWHHGSAVITFLDQHAVINPRLLSGEPVEIAYVVGPGDNHAARNFRVDGYHMAAALSAFMPDDLVTFHIPRNIDSLSGEIDRPLMLTCGPLTAIVMPMAKGGKLYVSTQE